VSADNHGEVLEFEAVSGVALHLAGRFLGKIRQMGGRFEVVRDPAQGPAEKHHTHKGCTAILIRTLHLPQFNEYSLSQTLTLY